MKNVARVADQKVMEPKAENSTGSSNIISLQQPNRLKRNGTDCAEGTAAPTASRETAGSRVEARLDRWAVFVQGSLVTTVAAKNKAAAVASLDAGIRAQAVLVLVTTYFKHSVRGGGPWWRLYRRKSD